MLHCWPRRPEIVLTTKRLTDAGTVVITLTEAKAHLRVDGTDEDDLITALIETAIVQAGQWTNRTFLAGTFKTQFDYFDSKVTLDVVPMDVTSIVVKYRDSDNVEQVLSADEYFVRDPGIDDYAVIDFNGTMPNVYNKPNSVSVEFSAGYAAVPAPVKSAVLMQVATLYENRQSEVVGTIVTEISNGAKQLLFPYRLL